MPKPKHRINDDIVVEALDFSLTNLSGCDYEYEDNSALGSTEPMAATMSAEAALAEVIRVSAGKDGTKVTEEGLKFAKMIMAGGTTLQKKQALAALGFTFSGPPSFEKGWEKLSLGIATGDNRLIRVGKGLYKKELNKLTDRLPVEFKKSPMMRDILAGAQDPVKLAARIKEQADRLANTNWGKKFGEGKAAVLKMTYAQAYSSIKQGMDSYVLPFLSPSSDVRKVYSTVTKGVTLLTDVDTDVNALIKKYGGPDGLEMDAQGVADVSRFVGKTITSIAQFVNAIPGMSEKQQGVVNEVVAWASTATGCVTGIAAGAAVGGFGAIAGAVGCAVAVLTKVLSEVLASVPDARQDNPMAFFTPYQSESNLHNQLPAVAADTVRLGNILRQHYNVPSYKALYDRLVHADNYEYWYVSDEEDNLPGNVAGRYPSKETLKNNTQVQGSKPPAGYTMFHALTVLSTDPAIDTPSGPKKTGVRIKNLLFALSRPGGPRYGNEDKIGAIEDTLGKIYTQYYDINVKAVEALAALGRDPKRKAAFLATGCAKGKACVGGRLPGVQGAPDKRAQTHGAFVILNENDKTGYSVALDAFVKMDEILNFFAAMTMFETERSWKAARAKNNIKNGVPQPYPDWWPYLSNQGRPIRFYAVGGNHRGEPSWEGETERYHKYCWTNLEACEIGRSESTKVGRTGDLTKNCNTNFRSQLLTNQDFCVAKELAFVKILSAFSYMHLLYVSDAKSPLDEKILSKYTQDVIADADKRFRTGQDPLLALSQTVDPRIAKGAPATVTQATDFYGSYDDSALRIRHMLYKLRGQDAFVSKIQRTARVQAQIDHRAETVIKLAKPLKLKPTTVAAILNGKVSISNIASQVMTLDQMESRCKAAGGVPAASRLWQPLCCPSLYYDQNVAKCKDMGGKCHTGCLDKKNYTTAILTPGETGHGVLGVEGLGAMSMVNRGAFAQGIVQRPGGIHIIPPAGSARRVGKEVIRLRTFEEYRKYLTDEQIKAAAQIKAARKAQQAAAQQAEAQAESGGSGINAGTIAVAAGAALLALKFLK